MDEELVAGRSFVTQKPNLKNEYERGWKISEVMPVNMAGFHSHRDDFGVDFDRKKLYQRIKEMRDKTISDAEFSSRYGIEDDADWQLGKARTRLRRIPLWEYYLVNCLYRSFDHRACYFSEV